MTSKGSYTGTVVHVPVNESFSALTPTSSLLEFITLINVYDILHRMHLLNEYKCC